MTAAQSVRHAEADAPDALSALRAVAARVHLSPPWWLSIEDENGGGHA